jgi:photosystem II stability/assembly factor-like uncharacterized protein
MPGGYLTRDGGRTWSEFLIQEEGRVVSVYDHVYVEAWFAGHILISNYDEFYCNEEDGIWKASPICSIVLRGQEGFRIEKNQVQRNYVKRTVDGGELWFGTGGTNVFFDRFDSFDMVSSNVIFALVRLETGKPGLDHGLVRSSNGGRSWTKVCTPEEKLDLYATHLFFLDSKTGWISSDRDDGLFETVDGGRTWRSIRVPERVMGDMFFRTSLVGRVIGGLSNDIYETNDGGGTWRKLTREEVTRPEFSRFFAKQPLSRWNDFAALRTLLVSSREKRASP